MIRKLTGRTLGLLSAGIVFALGLWAADNADEPWVVVAGYAAILIGMGMIGAVSRTIGKDFERWDRRK